VSNGSTNVPVGNWKTISTTGYSFAQVNVPAGDNEIIGSGGAKFAAIAMGGGLHVSYGYSSPYNIGVVGGTTTCYLGNIPPDYEPPFSGSAECNQDDNAGVDGEDAFAGVVEVRIDETSFSLNVPCNDNFYGSSVNAKVFDFIDFNRNGVFIAMRARVHSASSPRPARPAARNFIGRFRETPLAVSRCCG